MKIQDTICAIATAHGGALGIIRVSGSDAIGIADRIFTPSRHTAPLSERKGYTIAFGQIRTPQGEVIDEVLVSVFLAPHSYTGEDSIEISCHGSSYILQKVMQLLLENGCRNAEPGEFTLRAFINGKMDLTQAEAVADLIASSNEAAHKMAMNQMRGGFSRELSNLRDKLLKLTSLIELELDFSDHEELEFADRSELKDIAAQIEALISKLVKSFDIGNVIKNGVPTIIIGETNAGKSTLLNALLNEDRAIVSNIHGTTRDSIEEIMNINGIAFRFIDTAGIRKTCDEIENLGIERTFQKLDQAKIVLWVIDSTNITDNISDTSKLILDHCKDKKLIIVFNKIDLISTKSKPLALGEELGNVEKENHLSLLRNPSTIMSKVSVINPELPSTTQTICISAKNQEHIEELKTLIASSVVFNAFTANEVIITNVRHYEALDKALQTIHRIQESLTNNISSDLISQDLQECLLHLSEIIGGEITTSEVLENIFKNFCVGK